MPQSNPAPARCRTVFIPCPNQASEQVNSNMTSAQHNTVSVHLLQRQQALGCPAEGLRRKHIGNLPHQPRKWHLPDEELCGPLVFPDLPQRHCAWPVSVWLLHAPCPRRSVGLMCMGCGRSAQQLCAERELCSRYPRLACLCLWLGSASCPCGLWSAFCVRLLCPLFAQATAALLLQT
jgi:hypothetical protein